MNTLYIAGPMTGIEDFNYPAFHEAALVLRDKGWAVINPAENFDGDQTLDRRAYFRRAFEQLRNVTDGIVLLDGWRQSKGALAEVFIAYNLGHTIYRFDPNVSEALVVLDRDTLMAGLMPYDRNPENDLLESIARIGRVTSALEREMGVAPNDALAETVESGECKCGECKDATPVDFTGSIAVEAWDLVMGDRSAAYGHPSSDFRAMGRISGAILERWLESKGLVLCDSESRKPVDFPDIEPRIVALVQQAVKLSRESALPKRDNRVDGIGYWLCADRVVSGY
jgi:hypothetical protein